MADAGQELRQHPLQRARRDQRPDGQEPQGGLDLLDRQHTRRGGGAAHRRQHDVRGGAVPQLPLRARPRQRGRAQVGLQAAGGQLGPGGRLLRPGQPRRGLRRRQDLLQHARRPDGRRGRRDRQGGLAHPARRHQQGRVDHHGAAGGQGQGAGGQQRRRVRRPRLADRARRRDRQDRLEGVHHRPGQGRADRRRLPALLRQGEGQGPRRLHLAARRLADRRRYGLGMDLLRSRAQPDLLRHRQRRSLERGPETRATTSGRAASSPATPTPARRNGSIR